LDDIYSHFLLLFSNKRTRKEGEDLTMFKIKNHKGSTTLFIDGKPTDNILCYVSPDYYTDFKKANIHLITWHIPLGWIGPKKYDYTITDEYIENFFSLDPQALFLPRINFPGSFNDWWCQTHLNEMVKLSNGEISYYHSTASKIWRKEAAEALKRFICHVENSKYKDRIIGYHICDGHFQEWFAWGSATFEKEVHKLPYVCGSGNSVEDCSTPFPDYSKPMLNAFRDWLKTKYKNNPR
jgi:hypothetical protein